jgi:Rrf2 family protein
MKLLNRETDYAIRALLRIALNTKDNTSVAQLIRDANIPRPFLRKILQTLQKNRILTSAKGKGGGFRLALSPEQIRLVDIIRIFQGAVELTDCLIRGTVCGDIRACPLRKKIIGLERSLVAELNSVTLACLLKDKSAGRPAPLSPSHNLRK